VAGNACVRADPWASANHEACSLPGGDQPPGNIGQLNLSTTTLPAYSVAGSAKGPAASTPPITATRAALRIFPDIGGLLLGFAGETPCAGDPFATVRVEVDRFGLRRIMVERVDTFATQT
jgi:hypothetical protein